MQNIKDMLEQCVGTTTANVTLIDNETGVQLFSETMKDVGVDFKETTKDIKGGIGNKKLYSWGTDREIEVSLSDAMDRLDWTAAKFGQQIKTGEVIAFKKSKTYVVDGGKIMLEAEPVDVKTVKLFDKESGDIIDAKNASFGSDNRTVTLTGVADGKEVYVLGYNVKTEGVEISIDADKFAKTFEVIISTPLIGLREGKAETKFIKQYRFPMGRLKGEFKDDMKADSDGGEHSSTVEILNPSSQESMGKVIIFPMENLSKKDLANMGLAPTKAD